MHIGRRAILYLAFIAGSAVVYRYIYPLRHFFHAPKVVDRVRELKSKRNVFVRNGRSLVSVVEVEEVKPAVAKAVELIGGFEKIGVEGREVLVKPNVNSDDPYPATTNPEVVRAVVELLYEAGAEKVVVGDMSGIYWLPTRRSMERTGIAAAAIEAGAELAYFEEEEWVTVAPPGAEHLASFSIPKRVYSAEVLVSLPVVKTHRYATFSMSLKNFVGIVCGADRRRLHTSRHMEEMIAELNLAVAPDLVVMDGTRSMVAGGPTRGSVKETSLILASGDRVAVDVAGLGVIRSYGEWRRVAGSPWEQRQIKRAVELGLGAGGGDEVEVVEHGEGEEFRRLAEAVKAAVRESAA